MELGLVRVSWYERGSETLVCSLWVLAQVLLVTFILFQFKFIYRLYMLLTVFPIIIYLFYKFPQYGFVWICGM